MVNLKTRLLKIEVFGLQIKNGRITGREIGDDDLPNCRERAIDYLRKIRQTTKPEYARPASKKRSPLTELALHYQITGDLEAKEELARKLQPTIEMLARKYSEDPATRDDLVCEGNLRLTQLLNRGSYDPKQEISYKTWVKINVKGAMKSYLRDSRPLSRDDQKLEEKLTRFRGECLADKNRLPTKTEYEVFWGGLVSEKADLIRRTISSFDAHTRKMDLVELGSEDNHGKRLIMSPELGTMEHNPELVTLRKETLEMIDEALAELDDRKKRVLTLYGEGDSGKEIGNKLGMSPSMASRIRKNNSWKNPFLYKNLKKYMSS